MNSISVFKITINTIMTAILINVVVTASFLFQNDIVVLAICEFLILLLSFLISKQYTSQTQHQFLTHQNNTAILDSLNN